MLMRTALAMSAAILSLTLAGCGGGGSTTSAPQTYNLDHFVSAYVRAKHNYSLTATNSGNTYTLQLNSAPGPAAAFGSVSADTSVETLELFQNGVLLVSDTATRYYVINPYMPVGDYDATTGYVTVYAGQQDLPTAAKTGQGGSLATSTTYYDTSLTTVFGTETDTWRLEAGSGGNPVFCADSSGTTANGPNSESDCYTFDSAGDVLGLTITLDLNGVTLDFK